MALNVGSRLGHYDVTAQVEISSFLLFSKCRDASGNV